MNEPISQPTPDRLTIELRKPEHISAFTRLHAKLKLNLGLDLTNTQVIMWLMANAKE
jgi:hypothetical protein